MASDPSSPGSGPSPAPTIDAISVGLGAEAEVSPDLRQEILARIAEQVKELIKQARLDSEAKVRADLKVLNTAIQEMDGRLDVLLRSLDELETSNTAQPRQAVEQHTVAQALAKVEQQWGKELGKLKQELHQTIFAHNHNADLMKHQKDALDQIRRELESQRPPNAERLRMARAQLAKVDALLEGQSKQRRLEPLFSRLAAVEQRLAAAWRWGPMGGPLGGPMGPLGMAGLPQAMGAGVGAPSIGGAARGMAAPPGAGAAPIAAGGRGRGGQRGAGQQGGGQAAAKAAGGDKATNRYPTDEEVQARLAKAGLSGAQTAQGLDAGAPAPEPKAA